MQRRFYRMRDLATTPGRDDTPAREGRYPCAASTIWRWVKRGEFPQPVRLTGGTTAWPADVVEQWEASRGTTPNTAGTVKAATASAAARRTRRGNLCGGA